MTEASSSAYPCSERLSSQALPMVIFACKSDLVDELQVPAATGNAIGEPFNVGLIEVSATLSEGKSKMRNGLRWLLYKIEQRNRRHQRRIATSLQEPQNVVNTSAPLTSPADALGSAVESDASTGTDQIMWRQALAMSASADKRHTRGSESHSSSSSLQWMTRAPLTSAAEEPAPSSTAPARESTELSLPMEKATTSQSLAPTNASDTPDPPAYISLEDLFGKLFGKIVSVADEAFIDTFFMTFRRFCKPHELMQEFFDRLTEIEAHAVSQDIKLWALMKITGALIKWAHAYPGDLKDDETHALFLRIIQLNLKHTFMAHMTEDLIKMEQNLENVVDVDTSWAMKVKSDSLALSSPSELVIDTDVLYDYDSALEKSSISTPLNGSNGSVSSSSLAANANESGSIPRKRSGSEPRYPSDLRQDDTGASKWASAVQTLLTTDPRTFAAELTKMQWELFSSIRPRDILRHDLGKEEEGPVGKAIDFFNHLSRWVSTLILANPKPRNRARVYEQFVQISRQLRRSNNYDSLYAMISGMQETSVHRLGATHALVQISPNIEKDFQSHLKLVDPRGAYVHYRRALQADISHGRPAIPLLPTILVLVSRLQSVRPEDKREDGMIQWDKFVRFGQILSSIPECQQKGPMITGAPSEAFRQLIMDTPVIMNEDALFERSKMLEPSGNAGNVFRRLASLAL